MPLAAVIIPSPAPGAPAVRTDGAAAPERSGAAAAFDALLGDAVAADAQAGAGARGIKETGATHHSAVQNLNALHVPHPDVRFGADLADQDAPEGQADPDGQADIVLTLESAPAGPDAASVDGLMPSAQSEAGLTARLEDSTAASLNKAGAGKDAVQQTVSTDTEAERPAGASPDLQMNDAAARPAQSAIAAGEAAQVDAERAPAARNPGMRDRPVNLNLADSADAGARDAVQKPVQAPEPAVMPDAEDTAAAGAPDEMAPEKPEAPARTASDDEQPAAPPPIVAGPVERVSAPAPASDAEPGADADADPDRAVQTAAPAAPAPAPAPDAPANAASVRRESEPRRVAHGGDAGKAGDEPAKPTQSGAKAQAPSAPQAPAPAKSAAADMPAPQRSADAFQALLQAQTRPGAEAAAPRAPDLPFDPSGDAGLRSAPDRAAEILRPSGLTQAGAPPRFAPQTVQTLAAQIVRRQGEGGRVFEIRLDPPELGRVGVRLEMGKDQMVKAMLSAERPDTLQELQRTARDLERALAEAGLTLAEDGLSFSLGDERGERDGTGSDTPRGSKSVVEIDVARPGAPVSALYGFALARAAGLDIQA